MGKIKNNKGIKLIVAVIILAALVAGLIASVSRYSDKYNSEYSCQVTVEPGEYIDGVQSTVIKMSPDDCEHVVQFINDDDFYVSIVAECESHSVDESLITCLYIKADVSDDGTAIFSSNDREFKYVLKADDGSVSVDSQNDVMDVNHILTISKTYKEFGIIALILLVLIVIDIVVIINIATKTTNTTKAIFDERQLIARGKASNYGFIVAILYSIILALMGIMGIELPVETSALLLLGVMLSVGVNVCYSIMNDAYFALNQNRKALLVILAIIAVGTLCMTVMGIKNGTFISDGIITWNSAMAMLLVLVASIFVTLLIKAGLDKKEAE